jgi:hypothetical protein
VVHASPSGRTKMTNDMTTARRFPISISSSKHVHSRTHFLSK